MKTTALILYALSALALIQVYKRYDTANSLSYTIGMFLVPLVLLILGVYFHRKDGAGEKR